MPTRDIALAIAREMNDQFPELTAREARERLTSMFGVPPALAAIALRSLRTTEGVEWGKERIDWVARCKAAEESDPTWTERVELAAAHGGISMIYAREMADEIERLKEERDNLQFELDQMWEHQQ